MTGNSDAREARGCVIWQPGIGHADPQIAPELHRKKLGIFLKNFLLDRNPARHARRARGTEVDARADREISARLRSFRERVARPSPRQPEAPPASAGGDHPEAAAVRRQINDAGGHISITTVVKLGAMPSIAPSRK